ncbi:hypothetical protein L6307_02330 [Candidatus Parcubacteria bacterium]|nr:hypothetical protein [Candidatus Parcubacteria bacterium]
MFHPITKELFYTLTAALVIFCALELAWPGIVLAYININRVLIFWLIVGIVVVAVDSKKQTADK